MWSLCNLYATTDQTEEGKEEIPSQYRSETEDVLLLGFVVLFELARHPAHRLLEDRENDLASSPQRVPSCMRTTGIKGIPVMQDAHT